MVMNRHAYTCTCTKYFTHLSILTFALGSLCRSCCSGGTGTFPLKEAESKEMLNMKLQILTLTKEPSVCVVPLTYLLLKERLKYSPHSR